MFLYRPEVEDSCCAAYTIRLKVDLFKMSKEHRRTMHHMQRQGTPFFIIVKFGV
jgi:arginyl-tRNA--protein-N-Asp/Glu arginylyltransferase